MTSAVTNGSMGMMRRALPCVRLCVRALTRWGARVWGQERIGSGAGLTLVYKAMEAHLGHAGVQKQACGLLRNLSGNDANKVRVVWLGS